MSVDDPVTPLSAEVIAEDLSLSNGEGTSWYTYQLASELSEHAGSIIAEQWGDEGDVVAKFVISVSIKEIPL